MRFTFKLGTVALCLPVTACLLGTRLHGQEMNQGKKDEGCKVAIGRPLTGARVGGEVEVYGTASIKTGRFVWVFAHRKGLALWWPQGGRAAEIRRGEWSVVATMGGTQDRGVSFEIIAGVVDSGTDAILNSWVQKTEATASYPGMRLPVFVEGCGSPPRVIVTKTD